MIEYCTHFVFAHRIKIGQVVRHRYRLVFGYFVGNIIAFVLFPVPHYSGNENKTIIIFHT